MSEARVIAAFPATGKTHMAATVPGCIDLDSSRFSWRQAGTEAERSPYWPGNYISRLTAIRDAVRCRFIFVSSHAEVRAALADAGIPFTLVYPASELREHYRERMRRRGSPPALIAKVIDELWDSALAECRAQEGCEHIELGSGVYLTDALMARSSSGTGGDR